ncbi:MAG TPA: bifunctional diguanylate cyclase/phosphodiesterase [Micropepsaceae bacterium]|nr:bifunctional diguanylate cyclase/phosphodiesterase [Micropepsaceae bacterium]
MRCGLELESETQDAGVDDTEQPDALRAILLGAQAVAFDWSVSAGRICWDVARIGGHDTVEYVCVDHFGPFRALLDREGLRRLKHLTEEAFPQNPSFNLHFFDGTGATRRWFEVAALRIPGADGRADKIKGVIRTTGTGALADQSLATIVLRDELTGLLSRPQLREELSAVISQAAEKGESYAYLVASIDQLGIINQIHGYEAADEVIATVGQRLGQALRTADLIGRTAGNKFGILLKLETPVDLAGITSRLHEAVNAKPVMTLGGSVVATISIGAVLAPQHATNAPEAMQRAEEALAKARNFGRNGFALYAPSAQRDSERRKLISAGDEIVGALEDNRVLFAFQPIVRAKSRETESYECLLRIQRADGSILPAKDFIPAAEALGLVRLLDRRALEMAIAELYRNWKLKLAVNVSATTANDRAWLISFINYVREHRKVANRLTIELTETAALHCFEESARFISRLRDLGCRIAIDDFGAGHTSFRNLHQMRVDAVKIDGLYVEHLSQSAENQLFVRTLIDLARNLRVETVAEWVSSEQDAALLDQFGVDYFQGHHFGRPEIFPSWSAQTPVTAAA